MRRTVLAIIMATIPLAPAAGGEQSLTVALYGGQWGAALQKCVLDPFTAETGVTTVPEPGSSLVTMTKLKQQKDAPTIDVAWMDGGISELAQAEGLTAEIPEADLADLKQLVKGAVYRDAAGAIFALSTGFYSTGIVYNTSVITTPPESWMDLWKSDYSGKVTIPSPNNANGIPFFLTMAQVNGGNIDNVEPAVEKLRDLSVALYWDSAGAADNAFQSGEAVIGALHSANAWGMKDKGLPIGYAVPKEGIPAADIRVHIVKGGKNLEAARKLAAFTTRKEVSECLSETLYVGPVRADARLSAEAAARMPWGVSGSVDNLIFMDWKALNAKREALTQIWNERILSR